MEIARLLLTANDAGAAHHMVAIARALAGRAQPAVHLACSGPARQIAISGGIDAEYVEASGEDACRRRAYEIVDRFAPDVALCGLSSAGRGLDEAVLAAQQEHRRRAALLLDDRGPIPPLFGALPDLLVATSPTILAWAGRNCPTRCIAVDSPRHAALAQLPIPDLRAAARKRIGVRHGEVLLVYCLQDGSIPGHDGAFDDVIAALARAGRLGGNVRFALRGHPGYPDTAARCRRRHSAAAAAINADDVAIADLLAAADAVATFCSTSAEDYQWVMRGGGLNGTAIYVHTREEGQEWLIERFGDWEPQGPPGSTALVCTDRVDLDACMHDLAVASPVPLDPHRPSDIGTALLQSLRSAPW